MGRNVQKRGLKWSAILWDRARKKQRWITLPASIKSLREAESCQRSMQDDLDRSNLGLPKSDGKSTANWNEIANELIAEREARATPEWVETLKRFVGRFQDFAGKIPAAVLTPAAARDYAHLRALDAEAGAPSTLRKELTFLRAVFKRAGNDIFRDVAIPSEPKGKISFLTELQFEKLLAAAPPERAFRWRVMAFTGLRLVEAWKVRWRDFDLEARRLLIESAQKGKGTRHPFRRVPLCPMLLEALRQRRAELEACKRAETGDPHAEVADDLVFPCQCNWRRDMLEDCASGAVPAHTPSDLRDTYCSWLAQAGVSLHQIRDLAGHESITTTERYAHLCPDQDAGAAAALEQKYCKGKADLEKEARKKIIEIA